MPEGWDPAYSKAYQSLGMCVPSDAYVACTGDGISILPIGGPVYAYRLFQVCRWRGSEVHQFIEAALHPPGYTDSLAPHPGPPNDYSVRYFASQEEWWEVGRNWSVLGQRCDELSHNSTDGETPVRNNPGLLSFDESVAPTRW